MYEIPIDELLGFRDFVLQMPWWWFDMLVGWAALLGLMLWLLGRRMVRPVLGLVGAAVGAAMTAALVNRFGWGGAVSYWATGGAVVGAVLLGLVLWRVALALLVTAVVAVAVPCAVLAARGLEGPPIVEPVAEAIAEVRRIVGADDGSGGESGGGQEPRRAGIESDVSPDDAEPAAEEGGEEPSGQQAAEPPGHQAIEPPEAADIVPRVEAGGGAVRNSVTQPISAAWERLVEEWGAWWRSEQMEVHVRQLLIGAAVGGGILALLLGLAMPGLVSALMTALAGSAMMLGGIYRLAAVLPGDAVWGWLPGRAGSIAAVLAVGMIIGALLQWMYFRPKADK